MTTKDYLSVVNKFEKRTRVGDVHVLNGHPVIVDTVYPDGSVRYKLATVEVGRSFPPYIEDITKKERDVSLWEKLFSQ